MNTDFELALRLLPLESWNTIYMVGLSTLFSFVLGLPLGILLYLTDREGLKKNQAVYRSIATLVNIGRSIPFAILMIALIPFTRLIIGTSIGTTASIVPLTLAGLFFMARVLESAFKEVSQEVVIAAKVMGASSSQTVKKVVIPEAMPAMIKGITLTAINLVGYSTMAGLVGGGGLGKVAVQYGYQRFNGFIMIATLILILLLVEGIEWLGGRLAKRLLRKRGLA